MRIFSLNIGMEFGFEKCTMLIMKSRESETTERNLKNFRKLREKKLQVAGNIGRKQGQTEMKGKVRKKFHRRTAAE